jgi:FKBP-type peptidyl-prolyl cis-trans isomerase FklB
MGQYWLMQKPFRIAMLFLAAGVLLGEAHAQQTPATTAPPSPTAAPSGQTATAPKATTKTPAAKTGQAPAAKAGAPLALTTPKQKSSYAIGLSIGKTMKRDGVEVDSAALSRGLRDALSGAKPLLTDQDAQAALVALQMEVRKKQEAQHAIALEANKKEGNNFLAANKVKSGVVTLPSGLQYKILKEGTGPKPTASDSVVANYKGTLIDGTEFDSSYKRGQPATFPVGQVIKGWTEALQLMPVGSKWELFIPSDLAYGERGAGQGSNIGPNATLVFEVELLSIAPKEAQQKPEMNPEAKPEPKSDSEIKKDKP